MSYQQHQEYGKTTKSGMGFIFNYPFKGCVFDKENQRYAFLTSDDLSDQQLLNYFVDSFHYSRNWINKQWKPISEIARIK